MRGTAGYIYNSDIPVLDKIVQNTAMEAGRNLIIDALRSCFARDRTYHWVPDPWGFNKVPGAVGLDTEAGIQDDKTTRLTIGAAYRFNNGFLPSITVKQNNLRYKPISFNQNKWELEYGEVPIIDADNNITYISRAVAYNIVGLWESTFEVRIKTKSMEDTTKLHDLVVVALQSTYRPELQHSGLFIKDVSSNGEASEESQVGKDPVYTSVVILNTLSEWRRRIPVGNSVERFQICVDYDIISTDIPPMSGETRMTLPQNEEFRLYVGSDSFSLLTESNLGGLPFYFKSDVTGDYSVTVGAGESVYFCCPVRFTNPTFSAGGFSAVGKIVLGGEDYVVYRSTASISGPFTFLVT